MKDIVALRTNRDYYDVREAAEYSLTVDEVIDMLSNYPGDAKVVFSNDNGYTYGVVSDNTVKNIRVRMNESEDTRPLRKIKYVGTDKGGRRCYKDNEDRIVCDTNLSHRFGGKPEWTSKYRNELEGEPDVPVGHRYRYEIEESCKGRRTSRKNRR